VDLLPLRDAHRLVTNTVAAGAHITKCNVRKVSVEPGSSRGIQERGAMIQFRCGRRIVKIRPLCRKVTRLTPLPLLAARRDHQIAAKRALQPNFGRASRDANRFTLLPGLQLSADLMI
jgi:hypothetical protein